MSFCICFASAAYAAPGAVQNLRSTSGHSVGEPTPISLITMEWDAPSGFTGTDYYYVFNQSATHTFDVETGETVAATQISSEEYVNKNDVSYYFHVAATEFDWDTFEETIGEVTTYGPIRIDNVAPQNVSVSAPETTTEQIITLTLGASTDTKQMNISNSSYGSGDWETFSTSKQWELSEGDGVKTIYVQFKDQAGNTTNASTTTTYTAETGTAPEISTISDKTSLKNNSITAVFTISDANGGDLTVTVNSSYSAVVANSYSSFAFTNSTSNNYTGTTYVVSTTAEETVVLTLTAKPVTDITGTTTITLTVEDSTGLTSTSEFDYGVIYPDLDNSGDIGIDDVKLAFEFFMGFTSPTTEQLSNSAFICVEEDDSFVSLCDVKGIFDIYGGF